MASPVLCTEGVPTVHSIIRMLKTTHSAFPVLNIQGNVVGIIPKNFIIILLERQMWYDQTEEVKGRRVSMHYRRSSMYPLEGAPKNDSYLNAFSNSGDHGNGFNLNKSEMSQESSEQPTAFAELHKNNNSLSGGYKKTNSVRDNSLFNHQTAHSVDNAQFLLRKGTGVDIGENKS